MNLLQEVGQTYKNFTITKYLPLKELQATLIEATHLPTGAKVMHIANDDVENLFCLSFQTLPSSSNGVAHILEHTVLCGSEKFPVKDPFFAMTRRSLNTYMNALTGQDFTCYPASSQIEKDFYNLLEVYIDAVFHPKLEKLSFLQEGHRLEFAEASNPNSPLTFSGIVYNEMKGALSTADSRLWESVLKYLTPDLTYCHNSGGDPKDIPKLTHEELLKFHQTFYHPSHCLFFFYGNIPLSKHLDFIETHALSGVNKIAPLPLMPLQKRFSQPLEVKEPYPIRKESNLEKKHLYCLSFLTTQTQNQEEVLALCLLESLLLDTDASILKKALMKSGLCRSVDSSIDIEMSEIPFSIVCKGCEKKDTSEIKKIIFETLKNCLFSEEELQASLHQLEFERTEIDSSGGPFGLTLFFKAALIKQHGSEAEHALLVHTLFADLRAKIQTPNFLKNLIHKYFLDNNHHIELLLYPDPNLEASEKKLEEETLKQIREKINPEEILEQTRKLQEFQEKIESQSLECLPKLSLKDVPKHSADFSLSEESFDHLHVYHHEVFTNKILYADLAFEIPEISDHLLPLLSIYSKFITELGVKNKSYEEILHFQQAYTGGFHAQLHFITSLADPNNVKPELVLKGKCLSQYSDKLFFLFSEMLQGVDFSDHKRVEELLHEHATHLEHKFTKNALSYAALEACKGMNKASYIQEKIAGLSYYTSVLKWVKNPKEFISDLENLQREIVKFSHLNLILSCDADQFSALKNQKYYELSNIILKNQHKPFKTDFIQVNPISQARKIASPVAFTVKSFALPNACFEESASFSILTELLSNCHLHKEIREKGGAYGSGASYSPLTGNFYLYSYRDPNLSRTLKEFQKAIDKIKDGHFTKLELEEAKLGVIQSLDQPVHIGSRAFTAYIWKKSGRTLNQRQKFRDKILTITSEELVQNLQNQFSEKMGHVVSFLGENLLNQEVPKIEFSLQILPIET